MQGTDSCKWVVLHEGEVFSDMSLHVAHPNPHATLYFPEREKRMFILHPPFCSILNIMSRQILYDDISGLYIVHKASLLCL